ncbi:MAG: 3-hydroxyacyl-CoA dehydrogenase NAD-binding domain-containing protein [Planctomycetaceae bacterium]
MANARNESLTNNRDHCVCLIGAGTVGRAILDVHLAHGFDVVLADASEPALRAACDDAAQRHRSYRAQRMTSTIANLPAVRFAAGEPKQPWIVIESIPENLAMKHSLFLALQQELDADLILATNTSNLRVVDVFKPLGDDPRCCGLHFFMPVAERPLVECIATSCTSVQTQSACQAHAEQLGKRTLFVQDSPGFVVNRLLAPYLNQSLLMLERGVEASQLAAAAAMFGMPMSPLKLIDTIGLRTAFDSGRVFWQAFPDRLDPASILPGMLKAGRKQNASPGTFLESESLTPTARQVISTYQRERGHWETSEICQMIAIPMWIEAAELLASGVVDDLASIELAMAGGLGYLQSRGFFGFFDLLGRDTLLRHLQSDRHGFKALRAPDELQSCLLAAPSPRDAVVRYAEVRRTVRR